MFAQSYAAGQWDPFKVPPLPQSSTYEMNMLPARDSGLEHHGIVPYTGTPHDSPGPDSGRSPAPSVSSSLSDSADIKGSAKVEDSMKYVGMAFEEAPDWRAFAGKLAGRSQTYTLAGPPRGTTHKTDTSRTPTPIPLSSLSSSPLPSTPGSTMSDGWTPLESLERQFEELGYLVPPKPLDERERRRALHK